MTDIKFSCPQCGQHISCDEPWAGRQIECPVCHSNIVVPQVQAPSEVPVATVPSRGSSKAAGARLAPGVTQVPRPTARPLAPARKSTPRPPRSENSLLKYGVLVVVVAALGGVGYFYGLPLLTNALQKDPNANPPTGTRNSQTGGSRGGPMGEVNDAMDVSEALDGGSSARTRPVPPTNSTARPQPTPRR